jgi:hypothetical protein
MCDRGETALTQRVLSGLGPHARDQWMLLSNCEFAIC